MRNIRRSVALALAAIMMMAMNMVSFAADTAPAETEAVESVTRSTNGESVLLDKVYFACDGKNTISSREPIPATALDIENRILGSMEYFYRDFAFKIKSSPFCKGSIWQNGEFSY